MHPAAKQWDIDHGFVPPQWHTGPHDSERPNPQGRPCDWCGEPVEEGYIHPQCAAEERKFWLDILY